VVSELLANALRHALPHAESTTGIAQSRPIRLGLLDLGSCVLCAVADPSAQAPVHREPDWLEESGRGLQVVAMLSNHWGFCLAPDLQGKVVWATFCTSPQQRLWAALTATPALPAPSAVAATPALADRARAGAATPAEAAARFAGPAPRSRPRRSPPPPPSARDPACHTASCAAEAAGQSA
jgi:hypothetical protein